MSGQILKLVAQKALKNASEKNINSKDPFYEEVHVYGRDGRDTGKVKKQRKGIPTGLSQNDGMVLKGVRKQAYRLDMSLFNCCGIRFGWSSVIGFIPVLGDFLDLFMAWLVVQRCRRVDGGLPASIQSRMYFNIILDFGIGLVPFVGDLADAVFRANTRNAWILEEYLVEKSKEEMKTKEQGYHRKTSSRGAAAASSGQGKPQLPNRPGQSSEPQRPQAAAVRNGNNHSGHRAGHEMDVLNNSRSKNSTRR